MSNVVDGLTALNTELDAIENLIGPLVGGSGEGSVAECLLTLSIQIPGMVAGNGTMEWKNSASSNYVQRLLRQPLASLGASSLDWSTAIKEAKSEVLGDLDLSSLAQSGVDLLSNPVLGALTIQSTVVNQAIDQFIGKFDSSESDSSSQATVRHAFQSQLKQLFANNGLDLAATLAALMVYAAGTILPRIDREKQILAQMKRTLRKTRNLAVNLPPSMIPGVPNSLAIQLLCEAEGFLQDTKSGLRNTHTLNRVTLKSAGSRVCQAKTAVGGDMSSLPSLLQSQLKNMLGLSDLQMSTLLKGKFLPDPRLRIQQAALRNLLASFKAIDPSLVRFAANIAQLGVDLKSMANLNVAQIFATIIEILLRQVRTCRAQLEAAGAGLSISPSDLGKLAGASGTTDYKAAVKAGQSPSAGSATGATETTSVAGTVVNAIEAQASVYMQLVVLCNLMERISSVYPALSRLLDANNRLARLLEKLARRFSMLDCAPNQATALEATMKKLDLEIEKRLRGTVRDNTDMLRAFDNVQSVIEEQEKWLTCLERETKRVLDIFGLGQFADIMKKAMALSALAGRSAALAEMLATYDYKGTFNTTKNPFDVVLEALQCILQCNNPSVRAIVSDVEPSFKLLALGNFANQLTLPVLDSLQQLSTTSGNNRLLQLFMRLMRLLQALTSLSAADICAIGKPPSGCGELGSTRSGSTSPSNTATKVTPAGGFRSAPIIKTPVSDTVKKSYNVPSNPSPLPQQRLVAGTSASSSSASSSGSSAGSSGSVLTTDDGLFVTSDNDALLEVSP